MAKKRSLQRPRRKFTTPKECYFCTEKKTPWFDDIASLSKFVTERGKIVGRVRSGLCAMHQRRLESAVKYARHLALMPFVERI